MNQIEKLSLGLYPTPLYRLDSISRLLHTNVWIKRDDLCGVMLGGNKVRKLNYLLADAQKQGYDLVMTTGGAQSNHAMLTAACARMLGMEPILVLKQRGVCARRGNQILNYLMGVDVRFVDTDSYDDIYAEMDRIAEQMGRRYYQIPCGGSNPLGSLGYVDCMREVADSGVSFDHIVCACGSGGTAAGTALGAGLYLKDARLIAAMVDTDPFPQIVAGLLAEMRTLLHVDAEPAQIQWMDMCGPGYAIPSKAGNEAISLMLRHEGIVLDTCYTGKAFAALLQTAREGGFREDENVLFIHTGGAGGLFAPDWENEPAL